MIITSKIITSALKASVLAGRKVMEIYNEDFDVEFKDDNSPLTKADSVSNLIINKNLLSTGIPIISEENRQLSYKKRKDWELCWIVDPLDGTKEFIKKNGEFTINIALVEKSICKFGVIYVPVTRELYYTNHNKTKAFKTVIVDENKGFESYLFKNEDILKPRQRKNNSTLKIVGSRSHMNDETIEYLEVLKKKYNNVEIVSKGSSLKFCLVAEGKADEYPRFAPTMEWDTAAGQAICEAVGLKVLDKKTKKPMLYNRENLLNNYFLVTNNV